MVGALRAGWPSLARAASGAVPGGNSGPGQGSTWPHEPWPPARGVSIPIPLWSAGRGPGDLAPAPGELLHGGDGPRWFGRYRWAGEFGWALLALNGAQTVPSRAPVGMNRTHARLGVAGGAIAGRDRRDPVHFAARQLAQGARAPAAG